MNDVKHTRIGLEKLLTVLTNKRDQSVGDREQEITRAALSQTEVLIDAIVHLHRMLSVEEREHDDIPKSNCIKMFVHCKLCIKELDLLNGLKGPVTLAQPDGRITGHLYPTQSPQAYARLEVGWTAIGVQVWCNRHGKNVVHIDLEGAQHPVNSGRDLYPNE